MAEVFLCKRDQLTEASKRALKKAGVVVVEVEDPSACQFIRSSEIVSQSDMLWAALDALNAVDYGTGAREQRERLSANLLTVLLNSREGR